MADFLGIERLNDPNVVWMPLMTSGVLANTVEDISRNIEHTLGLDYIPFNKIVGTKSGAVAIVGSGPSLKVTWQKLRHFKGDIIACNSACKFLLEKGIVPTYMMCFDADKLVLQFIVAHPEVTYLLASRCVPEVFDVLKDNKIVVWHTGGDERIQELLEKHDRMEPMVSGGSAAVTRAMVMALSMGYTKLNVYGGDSSFMDGETHINNQSTTDERRMALRCNGRIFEVAPWMTIQVKDLNHLAPLFDALKIKVIFHGDGLLQTVAKELGFKTDYENVVQKHVRIFKREFKHKATILWQAI